MCRRRSYRRRRPHDVPWQHVRRSGHRLTKHYHCIRVSIYIYVYIGIYVDSTNWRNECINCGEKKKILRRLIRLGGEEKKFNLSPLSVQLRQDVRKTRKLIYLSPGVIGLIAYAAIRLSYADRVTQPAEDRFFYLSHMYCVLHPYGDLTLQWAIANLMSKNEIYRDERLEEFSENLVFWGSLISGPSESNFRSRSFIYIIIILLFL